MVESTPGGLFSARYTRSWRAGMRLPSTRTIWRAGSTRAPNRVTISPSTSTRPSAIRASQCLRLPSPAAARIFCSRTPGSGPVSGSISVSSLFTLDILDVVRQERGKIRQLIEVPQADALEEVPGRAVQDRAGVRVGARLVDEPPQYQRPHDTVAVDPAHRRHPGPAHRLPGGDHGDRFNPRPGEPHLLAVPHEPLHHGRALGPGVEPPAACHLTQAEPPALLAVPAR